MEHIPNLNLGAAVICIMNEAVPFNVSKAISLNCCPMKVHNYNLNARNILCDLQYTCQKIHRVMRYSTCFDFVVIHSPVADF